jgi:glycerol-1-phosphate dehydrogenase [NAD(P)+]
MQYALFETFPTALDPHWRIAVVCEAHTRAIAARLFPDHALLVLSAQLHASVAEAEAIAAQTGDTTHLIAVGSGTINDLVKYAAFVQHKPYISVPTAPSMNGYRSPTASLIAEGKKQSLLAAPPLSVWIDWLVLCESPWELIAAGVGDALCRSTVQCDWLLSHLLLDTPYDASLFAPMLAHEQWLMAHPEKLLAREKGAIEQLMQLLLLGGEAMRAAGSSAPASQGEHMIAHAVESALSDEKFLEKRTLHGHAIAVTTLTMARLQAEMLARPAVPLSLVAPDKQAMQRLWGEALTAQFLAAYAKKNLNPERIATLNSRLQQQWPSMAAQIRPLHVSADHLEALYRRFSLPTTSADLGWEAGIYAEILPLTRFTRERLTFLDLL